MNGNGRPRFVTAVSSTGSRIHAVDTSLGEHNATSLCRRQVKASRFQRFSHLESGTNCYLCRVRAERRLVHEKRLQSV